MARPIRVLHLEDSPRDAEIVRHRLDGDGLLCTILVANSKDSFEAALTKEPFDLIISDYNLPGYDGVSALRQARVTQPDVPVILVSGTVVEEQAVKCLQIGATDYLLKERLGRLVPAVQRALQEAETKRTRRRAEAALSESEARKAAILDSVLDCIVTMDADGMVIEFNASAERTFGYTKAEAIGRPLAELIIPPRFRQAHRAGLAHYRATGEGPLIGKLVEITAARSDGFEIPMELTITAIRTGTVRIFTGVLRDITARKQAEETREEQIVERQQAESALRQERDRAQRYLDTAEVILLALDPDGRIELVNRYACAVLGSTAEDLLGCNFIATCVPARAREAAGTLLDNLLHGDLSAVECPVLTKSGDERLIEWRNTVLRDDAGDVTGTFSSGADITERRLLEAQYQQAQKMEAMGRLAGGVAHDFNNLLTAILGYCELLLADLGPNDARQADIAEIQKAGTSAAGLTRQLLAFSRKEIIEPIVLNLNGVVTGMRALLDRVIGEDVAVALGLASDLASVKADRGQIQQIIMNLAVNARDAMPSGGTLTIETANVELDDHYARTHLSVKPGSYVALTVSDSGIGMTPEVQARLFEPFFTTKEPGKGTGLGLATVHGIVQRSGGSVNAYSEPGKGTSFKLYFPRVDALETVEETPPPAPRPHAPGATVLVVDDAEGLRKLTRRLLERLGYTVLVAQDAEEALRLFDGNASIDVLLTDVVMPGASGPELTRQLAESRPALKVIFMSGYTEEAIVRHGVLNAGIAFLHKPFTSEMLGRKMDEVLDR